MQDINGSTLYGWKMGDSAWRQIAPPLGESLAALTVAPMSDGSDALWIFEMSFNGNATIDRYTALQAQILG